MLRQRRPGPSIPSSPSPPSSSPPPPPPGPALSSASGKEPAAAKSTSSSTAVTSATSATSERGARKRRARKATGGEEQAEKETMEDEPPSERRPLLDGRDEDEDEEDQAETAPSSDSSQSWSRRNQWIVLALASGACAAFNGVFAKLTTTELTSRLAHDIAALLGLSAAEGAVEVIARCIFFALNLVFNGVMWTLFTTALARGQSTTQVSIMNTSSNFVLTALLGLAIFSESLPPLWWLGAAMLVAGNVIIGRKDEGEKADTAGDDGDDGEESRSVLHTGTGGCDYGGGSFEHEVIVTAEDLAAASAALVPEEKEEGDEEDDDILDLGEINEL